MCLYIKVGYLLDVWVLFWPILYSPSTETGLCLKWLSLTARSVEFVWLSSKHFEIHCSINLSLPRNHIPTWDTSLSLCITLCFTRRSRYPVLWRSGDMLGFSSPAVRVLAPPTALTSGSRGWAQAWSPKLGNEVVRIRTYGQSSCLNLSLFNQWQALNPHDCILPYCGVNINLSYWRLFSSWIR